MYNAEYFNKKWENVIKSLPVGGNYRFDLRQYGYNIIKEYIKKNSKVFDYACGLGIIDIQLEKEKNCKVYGCDISETAINYINKNIKKGKFKISDKIFGNKYDYLIAIYFLEHIKDPCEFLDKSLDVANEVIVAIPNNFNKNGEHIDMQWKSWESFFKLFKDFKIKRLDENKYPNSLIHAFKHPIFSFKR